MINITEIITASNSETISENHIPSIPNNMGRSITAAVWNTNVRRKEITADVSPSFKAVKNPEANIAYPINKNAKEYITKPRQVRVYNS